MVQKDQFIYQENLKNILIFFNCSVILYRDGIHRTHTSVYYRTNKNFLYIFPLLHDLDALPDYIVLILVDFVFVRFRGLLDYKRIFQKVLFVVDNYR